MTVKRAKAAGAERGLRGVEGHGPAAGPRAGRVRARPTADHLHHHGDASRRAIYCDSADALSLH